ncbi:MAG: hypothetical protein JOZ90_11805 [Alphaproteobacteria bacterium]|nr:hypothetical protein [Alphaproteobacteria bacterium]MBV9371307.1 hypothetical protein [Alphaproteobacteria bacterium]MBV9901771.1 hypothetical protein [Alphaproteobacteria bacterium]
MSKLMLGAALSLALAAGAAQGSAIWQPLLKTADGVSWFLKRGSLQTADATGKVYGFWIRSENPATQRARQTMVQVKLACGQGWYVPLHVTLYDANGRILRDDVKGDAAANWVKVEAGGVVDVASKWVCR